MSRIKIKKGDTVKVISGKDKGKTGKVLNVYSKIGKITVENVNVHTKFVKSRRPGQSGQKVTAAAPFTVSKVMLLDPHSGKPSRIGHIYLENGTKQRVARASGKAI